MIISRTPLRISFFGGGTDFPKWYNNFGGTVISTTIDKYIFLSIRDLPKIFKNKYHLRYSKNEMVNSLNKIQHPSIREVIKYLKVYNNLDIAYHPDLPGNTGLGSSSSFTVGLLKGLSAFKNMQISKKELALSALDVEQNIIKEDVGSQDQVAAAFGGFNKINFQQNGEIYVEPIIISKNNYEKLQDSILLFFTGFTRIGPNIQKDVKSKLSDNLHSLNEMKNISERALEIIYKKNLSIRNFGNLLDKQWHLKKNLSNKISNTSIDNLYKKGIKLGSYGGKILGAGGGGFMMFVVEKKYQKKFIEKFPLLNIPFKFENTGSSIIYFDRHQ